MFFPTNMNCGSLEKQLALGLGQEVYQTDLKHPFVSESKAASKDNWITECKLYLKISNRKSNWGPVKRT